MEATREIYWNVGHGVLAPMYLLAFAAVGAMAYGVYTFSRNLVSIGKPETRTDNISRRLALMGRDTLLQLKALKGGGAAGMAHALFFWSFLVLTAGTTLVFIQADFTDPLLGHRFLTGGFYKLFSLALDMAGLVAILAIGWLFIRRYFLRPPGLESSWEDALAHTLLFLALVTGFMVEGLRMAATELDTNMALAYWSPVGLVFAKVFHATMFDGAEPSSLLTWHKLIWWSHFLICLGFFTAIGYTKLRHIFLVPASYALMDMGPVGKLVTLDLEDENAQQFGAAAPADLLWKDLFDTGACVKCKRCQDACPAHFTGKPLSPMKLVTDIGAAIASGAETPLFEVVGEDAVWACVTCRACQQVCPAGVEHVRKVIDIRRNLALMEGKFPGDEVARAMDAIEVNGNPLGYAPAARGEWAEGMAISTDKMNVLYFAGCYASYDRRNIKVARALVGVLDKLGVKAGILGKREKCCGEPARKMGNEYLYQSVAAENIEAIHATGAKKIVTTCPHCFHTLDKEYRDLGLDASVEVEHYTTFLAESLDKFKAMADSGSVTYHDSCYMGRYSGVFDQPRALLSAIGAQVTEMERSRESSFCCGGGGGRVLAEESLGRRINAERALMAGATGAGSVVSNCPFCLTMLEDGVKTSGLEDKIKTLDLIELLAERL
ncbi:MAG: heterodisulfide reductase-related iron-sulfur binding cluster [Nitrospinota bacterium]|nr:heterodisulfide reductase-related iron-sulfur binding cluster [Nitrospinota bacterium]